MRGTGAPRPRFSGWEDVSSPSRFRIFACRRPKIGRQPKRIICSRRKSRLEILQRLLSISRLQSLGWREKTYKSSKVLEVEDISIDLTHRMCCRSTRQRARGGIARGGSLTPVLCGALHLLLVSCSQSVGASSSSPNHNSASELCVFVLATMKKSSSTPFQYICPGPW